ncbi:MAG: helix-turn-helix transcriptional regulator [Lachnospiraceae bacterium]|nr:helix-turn-helix transcriptional regulator [Lachnospiraceae bacterium]
MNWEEYKNDVKSIDSVAKEVLEEAEAKAEIITAMINRRNDLGLSQRDLAEMCGIPQSSVARIESNKTVPKLDTLIKIFTRLGLRVTVMPLS